MGNSNKIEIGEISQNNFGTKFTMIQHLGNRKVRVKFLDKHGVEKDIDSWEFRRGNVVNPYDAKVYGIGYIGEGDYSNSTHRDARAKWARMLDRCYSGKERLETYEGCRVSEKWHNFQNFAKWYETEVDVFRRYNIKVALDKDLLSGKFRGKLYSEETCCLLPYVFNSNVSIPLKAGVVQRENSYFSHNSKYAKKIIQGSFLTYDDAYMCYVKTRKKIFNEYIEEYKHVLSSEIIDKLLYFCSNNLKG